MSLGVLAFASLSGGLTWAVTEAGRTAPTSASTFWVGVFLGSSLALAAWGLLYAHALHQRAGFPWSRSLYLSALCHLPLLAGLGLVQAVYTDDLANHVYSASAYGQVAYRPLVLGGLVAGPALLQGVVAAVCGRRRIADCLAVVAPLGMALGLRFWSLDWQLPYRFHDDEQNYLGVAMIMWAHGDPNPHRFLNPSLLAYADVALYLMLGGERAETFRVFAEAFGRRVWDPTGFYLVSLAARGVVALLGTGTVAIIYLTARELFDRRAGLLAAWFLAVSLLHVRNSHYATNDVAATFFISASFLFAARLYRSGRRSDYLWAGALGGLAVSTKYNAGLFVLPILVAHLVRPGNRGVWSRLLPADVVPLVVSGIASGLGFLLGTPYSLLDWPGFIRGFWEQLAFGAEPWFGQQLLPTWWLHLAALAHGLGWLPTVLVVLGTLHLLRCAPGRLALVAAFPAGYYAFMAAQQLFFARFAIPMLPFAALLAGCGAALVSARLSQSPFGRLLVPALLVAALAQPALNSIQSNLVIGRADTRVEADRWLFAHAPGDAVLLVDSMSDLWPNRGWPTRSDLQVRLFDPFKDPAPWKGEPRPAAYVAISSYGYQGILRGAGDPSPLPEPYAAIEREGCLVASFEPGRGEKPVGYSQDDTYTPFWYVMERERPGPTVRIYRMVEEGQPAPACLLPPPAPSRTLVQ